MQRSAIVTVTASLLLIGLVVSGHLSPSATAQNATPETAQVSLQALTFAPVGELPRGPAIVGIVRVTFPVGAVLPLEAGDPSLAVVYVESGSLTVRLDAPATILRAPEEGATDARQEESPAKTDFTLAPGDSFVSPAIIAGEARNAGTEPVIVLAAVVEPEPAVAPTAATPTTSATSQSGG